MPQRLLVRIVRIVGNMPHGPERDRARELLFRAAGSPFGLSFDHVQALLALAVEASRVLSNV